MELRLLKYFWTIAEEGTISRAAEVLHHTQPTLSRQLKELEEELGIELFVRENRKMILTDTGYFLKSRAEEILDLTNQTTQEFENRKKQLFSGRFTIGCVEADNSDTLALLLEELIRDYPSVQFHIHSGTSDDITERLEKGLLDLAILLDPVDTEKYETILLPRKEKWGLLISKASDLAQKDAIKKEDFSNVSLLISKRPEIQRIFADWLGIKKEQLLITGTYNLIFNVFSLIENQVGAALVIEGAVSHHSKEVRFVPLDPLIETNCMLFWKKNRILSPVVNELIHRFKEAFEQ
ncbi:LysR family transcriptional regulator [Enterococcus faecium]|uniref:LysR family transcriptional regulator n=1 Tax=Enterococcus faecium TaxID=1352 RepID=UPI000DEB8469|nr:LysR family transcriptional regulator [Enterococcus faecium]RCF98835.1 LysR family transcriptional regulator [Enterococcus faecium]RCN99656.1 LysR family transcriptional regulator [Enterococcus faecium]